jgi:spermidine dehydrogenase
LTFYVPFYAPGKPAREQEVLGRTKLLSTSFQDYERQIRETLAHVFGMSGFDPQKDIAGIILNRWGHSVIVPVPGLLYGRDGQPAPIEVAQKPFGRIAFAHSELEGGQSFGGAASFAKKAVDELLAKL